MAPLEEIGVLKGGASAIYGSEAVAGMINFVTRKDMEGFVAESGYLVTRGRGAMVCVCWSQPFPD